MATVKKPARARQKKPLDRERIERAAVALIEEHGLAAFSMRALGTRLGVEAMSLYHHFASKAHLLDALVDRLISTLPDADHGLSWREQTRNSLLDYRALLLQHPQFAQHLLLHRMNTRVTLAWLERTVAIFARGGFDAETGARAFRTVGYFVMGAILDETAGYARGPTAADPVSPEEQRVIAPTVVTYGRWFAAEHWERTFLSGLDLLLDRLEEIRRGGAPAPGSRKRTEELPLLRRRR